MINSYIFLTIVCSFIAISWGLWIRSKVLEYPTGSIKMMEIASYIQEGAKAYMKRQYSTIFVVALFIFAIIGAVFVLKKGWLFGLLLGFGFLLGAVLSALCGYIGMHISVKANIRTAQAAKFSLKEALDVAFKGGTVTGLLVVGLGLLGVAGYYLIIKTNYFAQSVDAIKPLVGMALGASLISVFARLGGGIYTKAADMGADLVGKTEADLPEDDPRNPAVIADNVGDNVGDCAGMAADLFETYTISAIASMLIGAMLFNSEKMVIYPLLLAGISAIASVFGTMFVKLGKKKNIIMAFYKGLVANVVFALAGFWIITFAMFPAGLETKSGQFYSPVSLYIASLVGIAITAFIFSITDYYTSNKHRPVQSIAEASVSGHATNIVSGISLAMRSTMLPALVIVLGIITSYSFAGLYGVSIAAMSMLSMAGMIISLDAFGPITDNAGGIVEMSGISKETRNVTNALDSVGNTTKAVTKGYAIGSAGLAAIVLFSSFILDINNAVSSAPKISVDIPSMFSLYDPYVISGLFMGGIITFVFASLAINSVAVTGSKVVKEVRRQFKENPGILEGTVKPDYVATVDIVTKDAIRQMIVPALLPVILPLVLFGFGKYLEIELGMAFAASKMIGGMLIGSIVIGLFTAIAMTIGGSAFDNAKKYIEAGNLGGKGSFAHQASITGDTAGDPCKDTAGPAINPMIKVLNIIAMLLAVFLV